MSACVTLSSLPYLWICISFSYMRCNRNADNYELWFASEDCRQSPSFLKSWISMATPWEQQPGHRLSLYWVVVKWRFYQSFLSAELSFQKGNFQLLHSRDELSESTSTVAERNGNKWYAINILLFPTVRMTENPAKGSRQHYSR